jgi:hypothetical protein
MSGVRARDFHDAETNIGRMTGPVPLTAYPPNMYRTEHILPPAIVTIADSAFLVVFGEP